MVIQIRSKNCPNCGGNLRFDINDLTTICPYCGSQILIEHYRTPGDDIENSKNKLYVNTTAELCKWLAKAIIGSIIITLGFFWMFATNPIFGIMIMIAGVFAITPIKGKNFQKKLYIKIFIILAVVLFGLIGGAAGFYEIPSKFRGKYVSDTTNMTVEIRGNTITVNDNEKITKERIYCWEETYGTISVINIKVNNGEYNFRLQYVGDTEYKFYESEHYGKIDHYFYNIKNKEKFICSD